LVLNEVTGRKGPEKELDSLSEAEQTVLAAHLKKNKKSK
jgi:hypothetical protein